MANLYTINSSLNDVAHQKTLKQIGLKTESFYRDDLSFCNSISVSKVSETDFLKYRHAIEELKLDYFYSELPVRHPKLAVFDMDSTLIPIEVIDELASFANKKTQVSEVTELAMQGKLDFNQSLISRVKLLKGLSESVITELSDNLEFNPGVEELCNYLINSGSRLAIASGGFMPFAKSLQNKVDFSFIKANELVVKNGVISGDVSGVIINAQEKAKAISQWCHQLGISEKEVMAVGDGANDLLMLNKAGLGVAYHAKPKVNQSAKAVLKYASMAALIDLFEVIKKSSCS